MVRNIPKRNKSRITKKRKKNDAVKVLRLAAALTARTSESVSRCTCSAQGVASSVSSVAPHQKSTGAFPRPVSRRVRGRAVYCADFIPRWTCKRPEGPNPSGPANMLPSQHEGGKREIRRASLEANQGKA